MQENPYKSPKGGGKSSTNTVVSMLIAGMASFGIMTAGMWFAWNR